MKIKKQTIKQPIPLTLEQYECQTCKKKFYINTDDTQELQEFACPFCEDSNVLNVREFDVEILSIGVVKQD